MEVNIGDRFGRLTVESLHRKPTPQPRKPTVRAAMVKCDCGSIKEVVLDNLMSGNTTSCGCYHREVLIASLTKYPNNRIDDKTQTLVPWKKHGQSRTKLYRKWKAMIRRCESERAHNYKWYGAKGVKVCPEWRNDFMAFHDWAYSTGYEEGLEIARDGDVGDYSPDNCCWLTKIDNIKEKRRGESPTNRLAVSNEVADKIYKLAQMRDISPGELIRQAVDMYDQEVSF